MRVVLFRHGPAGKQDPARWPDDRERPLTPRGQARTRAAARGLARLERRVSHVITSPLARAQQTAKLVHEAVGGKLESLDALAPGGARRALLERLGPLADGRTVVLVGHEPGLGELAGALLGGSGGFALPLRKAGACAIDFESAPRAGAGTLSWFAPPRLLRRLARRGGKAGRGAG